MPAITLISPDWFKPSMVKEPIDPDNMVGLEGFIKRRLIRWFGRKVAFVWRPTNDFKGRKLEAEGIIFRKIFYCERANVRGEDLLVQGLPGGYGWTNPE